MCETPAPSATERWAWCCPHCSKLASVRCCPFGDGHPYDLAVDQDGELRRVQCKTGRLVRGAVVFATTRYTGGKHRTYQEHEIDYFGVYCPDAGTVCRVPITDVPDRGACLRVKPTKNNQAKSVRWAKDYVLGGEVEVAAAAG